MKPEKGMTLGGRYALLEQLAVGGMGEVWAARDNKLHRTVALKVLREEYTGHQEFLRRLRTEARNSAALAHPNIAQMYDYGEEDGTGYLVMELVKGEPLSDLLERQGTVPTGQLLPILAQTARGLHHAHQNAVVHRDVKPGNILLEGSPGNADPGVKITDFGVSLAANQAPMTATGMVMGTAQYLSPEQAIGKPATARSDIYALGVVAYEAVAGRRPFTGKSPVDIAIAHVNSPVPPLPADADPALSKLIMRMLAKEPSTRPGNASILADELEKLMAAQPGADSAGIVAAPAIAPQPLAVPSALTTEGAGIVAPPKVVPSTSTTGNTGDSAGIVAPPKVVSSASTTGGTGEGTRKPRRAGHIWATNVVPDDDPIPPVDFRLRPSTRAAIPKSTIPNASAIHLPEAEAAAVHGAEFPTPRRSNAKRSVLAPPVVVREEPEVEVVEETAAAAPVEPKKLARPEPVGGFEGFNPRKARRGALALLIGVFAILGLLLLLQTLLGRSHAVPEPPAESPVIVETVDSRPSNPKPFIEIYSCKRLEC